MPSRRTWRTATRASSRVLVRDLDHLLAPLLVQFRNADAQHRAFDRRAEAEIGVADRLVDRVHHALVPNRDGERARLGNADGGDLIERHPLAVGFHLNRLEQARARAAGPQAAEFVLERSVGGLHAPFEVVKIEFGQLRHVVLRSIVLEPRARTRRTASRGLGRCFSRRRPKTACISTASPARDSVESRRDASSSDRRAWSSFAASAIAASAAWPSGWIRPADMMSFAASSAVIGSSITSSAAM